MDGCCSARGAARVVRNLLQIVGACTVFYGLIFGYSSALTTVVEPPAPTFPEYAREAPPPVVNGCSDEQMKEAVDLLGSFVHSLDDGRPQNRGRHGLTPAEYLSFPCTRFDQTKTKPTTINEDVVFVMIASSKEKERAIAHRQTWANHVTMLMMADVNDTEVGLMALPAASGEGYWDAQHRTLYGLKYAVAKYPNARWFGMIDDDTFINPDMWEYTVAGWDWRSECHQFLAV
jgi:hypothetical protein